VLVAHKTGTMPGTVNDAGILTSPDGRVHIAIAVMSKGSTAAFDESEQLIARIGRAVWDAWARPNH
jgi:beta-lactamase class A